MRQDGGERAARPAGRAAWDPAALHASRALLPPQDKEKKKKESILDLSKYIDKTIRVKFQGGREGETPPPAPRERPGASAGGGGRRTMPVPRAGKPRPGQGPDSPSRGGAAGTGIPDSRAVRPGLRARDFGAGGLSLAGPAPGARAC